MLRGEGMTLESVKEELIKYFCKEYQSVWIIKLSDLSMKIFSSDSIKSIPKSIDTALELNSYESSRLWYIDNYVVPHDRARLLEQTTVENILSNTSNGDAYYVEYGRIKNDEVNYNQICYDRIVNKDGKTEYFIQGFRNIDVRKKSEIDDLTGLLTRHAFIEKAERLLHSIPDGKFRVIISDIVDFKKINETYGIKMADKILKWNGEFLSQIMSDNVLVGRYGSDQMVIFGLEEDLDKAENVIGGSNFEDSEKNNGLPNVTMKFGVYSNVNHKKSIISSCDKAHMALNSIKHRYDKHIAMYDDSFKDEIDKRHRIEKSMHESLKNGDFKVFYQPKHNAVTGELVGAEALIRWIHPDYGFMSPGDFIPLFEQNGFIVESDRYVWRRTCENLRRWENMGLNPVPISVNASKLTMSREDLIENMLVPVEKENISPNLLHIEITETLMAEDVEDLVNKLKAIREAGFEVELDDFGAGYSSINVLSTLPLDVVKLDMSFMQQFGDEKRAKVLAASINLAKELGYKTVSEGVELKEQNEVLGELGVDIIQGYYYSKPLPEAEFEKYLLEKKKGL